MTLVYRDVKGAPVLAGETSARIPPGGFSGFVRLARWFERGGYLFQTGIVDHPEWDGAKIVIRLREGDDPALLPDWRPVV